MITRVKLLGLTALLFLTGAVAIPAAAQCVDHPWRDTAIVFHNASSYQAMFYVDDA